MGDPPHSSTTPAISSTLCISGARINIKVGLPLWWMSLMTSNQVEKVCLDSVTSGDTSALSFHFASYLQLQQKITYFNWANNKNPGA